MSATFAPRRLLSKSKLSMYLRTQCDRELYLSLFHGKPLDVAAAGLPAPLKSRPNVQLVTGAGNLFENQQYKMLIERLPGHVKYNKNFADLDFAAALPHITAATFCIQPAVEPQEFRGFVLNNLGVAPADQGLIPPLSGMRPDLVLVAPSTAGDWEVLPNGGRVRIQVGDKRMALSVIDLKNVAEGNASYAAEVCPYAVFLSNWLAHKKLEAEFYVSELTYLWTTPHLESFDALHKTSPTAPKEKLIAALMRDLERESVDFVQFIPSVRKFFADDVPRVIKLGDSQGWAAVDYHVTSRCGACDWLGNRDWLSPADIPIFDANPERYCVPAAEATKHLSQVANLSRAARKVLEDNFIFDVPKLASVKPSDPALRLHSFLKRSRNGIGSRATALMANAPQSAQSVKLPSIATNVELRVTVAVTFDSSANRLTGIGLRSDYLPPYGVAGTITNQVFQGFMVERNTDDAEWLILERFIDALVSSAEKVAIIMGLGAKLPYTQIYFWEMRQYEELCKAFGRHLSRVLGLRDRKRKALAWLFPAEDLLESEEGAISPAIVFVQDLVERAMHLPVPHVYTLLGTARVYSHPSLLPLKLDTFYSEPLTNGVPRERTFEIWTNTSGVVEWGLFKQSLSNAVQRYESHLRGLAYSLTSVVARLALDFKGHIKGRAKRLELSVSNGAQGMAFDSKLWQQWSLLEHSTATTEAGAAFTSPVEDLESRYETIVLEKIHQKVSFRRYLFVVSPDSLESKLEAPDAYLRFGVISKPGFPLETVGSLQLTSVNPALPPEFLRMPMHRVLSATLHSFDRTLGLADVEFRASFAKYDDIANAAFDNSILNLAAERMYLLKGLPPEVIRKDVEKVLSAIGDASNAAPDPNALRAMGKAGKTIKKGSAPATYLSHLLWDARSMVKGKVRTPAEAAAIVADAKAAAVHPLNPSQEAAVAGAAEAALSLIWGPPGTGKTDTLAALVVALVRDAVRLQVSRKILLTGPNYRAVEVLADRVLQILATDSSAPCDFYRAYSKSRELPISPTLPAHVNGESIRLESGTTSYANFATSLRAADVVTLVATSAHAARKVGEAVDANSTLVSLFDVVVIDESSQVPVTLSLLPLATLRDGGQVVIAGDPLQMPPIASLDPPLHAEYLVGSIHSYLVERFKLDSLQLPLLENYRSNQDIVDYALSLGYPPKLKSAHPNLRLHEFKPRAAALAALPAGLPKSPAWEVLLDPNKPVCTLIHEDETASQANVQEAKMVAALVWGIWESMSYKLDPLPSGDAHDEPNEQELFESLVGIVTPHKAQRALVLSELRTLFPKVASEAMAEAVDTVEKFQGGQRQTIIVSFGVGDVDIIQLEEFFLLQLERINVAVSRAEAKSIVLMPKSLAYHLPSERKTLKTAKAIKSYLETFCNQRQRVGITFADGTFRQAEVRWHG